MKKYNISEMYNGWFIGNFEPSIIKTKDFEVAHHTHKKGYVNPEGKHYHKICTEVNYIVNGKVSISEEIYNKGDFFVYYPNEISNVIFLEDTDLIVIKTPSVPSDKYIV